MLSPWAGSWVCMEATVTVQEELLVPPSDSETTLTELADEYGGTSPKGYQHGESVLARGLQRLVLSL